MAASSTDPARHFVVADGLAVGYEGRIVLDGLDFRISPGMKVGLLGPNGGGKTTLFRALLGQIQPLDGSLSVDASCATVPQSDRSRLDYPVTCLDVATMGALSRLPWWKRPGRRDREKAFAALETVGLAERSKDGFGDLSGGQRQRVLIARALTADAELLLLDEPYTGLDSTSAARLDRLINDLAVRGCSVMIATHDVDQARVWDQVLCLNGRQIAFGHPQPTLSREVLEATYGGHIVEIPGQPGQGLLPAHHCDHEHEGDH
ncbi:MAG: metal ABC transporter ATP-binding protein [Solirubrobacterales bacterium]